MADMEMILTMAKFSARNLNVYYGDFHALRNINIDIPKNKIDSLIGPSGCGKSTFLRVLNRLNDEIEGCKVVGDVLLDGENIYRDIQVNSLRKRVGMVFQKPNPFHMSIYDNVAFGPKVNNITKKSELDFVVEQTLRAANLWDEVKNKLKKTALGLSGGQQQRLCIARALAVGPEVLLLDEPTSALDPISSGAIEELLTELRNNYSVIVVTHDLQQAARISNSTAFFLFGELVEFNITEHLFSCPQDERTEKYVKVKFG